MRPEPDAWVGRLGSRVVRSKSREGCLAALRRLAGDARLTIEVTPELVGVSEAAQILGWDRRRVATYVSRGAFPEPVATLASGRVWRREDVEAFGADRVRRKGRRIHR
jgi:predicted DNA-binding transcriptional regulator AlpA